MRTLPVSRSISTTATSTMKPCAPEEETRSSASGGSRFGAAWKGGAGRPGAPPERGVRIAEVLADRGDLLRQLARRRLHRARGDAGEARGVAPRGDRPGRDGGVGGDRDPDVRRGDPG